METLLQVCSFACLSLLCCVHAHAHNNAAMTKHHVVFLLGFLSLEVHIVPYQPNEDTFPSTILYILTFSLGEIMEPFSACVV